MSSRTTTSIVTFAHPFAISGYDGQLPAGRYEWVVDEELLEGLSFEAYRRTGSFLLVTGQGEQRGETSMRPVDPRDLEAALARDRVRSEQREPGDAALSAQEHPS